MLLNLNNISFIKRLRLYLFIYKSIITSRKRLKDLIFRTIFSNLKEYSNIQFILPKL
jgi:hypothetical protein